MGIQISHFPRYYLRYEITRDDMVRLSPSILRDFLSFTLFSLPGQREAVIERQMLLSRYHREVGLAKVRIARTILIDILDRIPDAQHAKICAFIVGDLAYFPGHSEPRKVRQSGEMVRGSDIDIIIVHDRLDDEYVELIAREMMQAKNFQLRHPAQRQAFDYICKACRAHVQPVQL